MGKRKGDGQSKGKAKKFKVGGFIDPATSGVYATCTRGKEQQCRKELMNLFSEKIEQYFDLSKVEEEGEEEETKKELSIEEQIQKELGELKETKDSKKEFLKPIDLGCECLVFIKTKRPIEPETLVQNICKECATLAQKTTRYTQRLTPITMSALPTIEELMKLARRVLKPHFHKEEGQEPVKFAIQVSKRNFNALSKGDIIKRVAECVGQDHGHKVDLKNYDKLIMIEGYKSNIGMSVVDGYDELEKFNLQQIFDKTFGEDEDGESRVKKSGVKEEDKEEINDEEAEEKKEEEVLESKE